MRKHQDPRSQPNQIISPKQDDGSPGTQIHLVDGGPGVDIDTGESVNHKDGNKESGEVVGGGDISTDIYISESYSEGTDIGLSTIPVFY